MRYLLGLEVAGSGSVRIREEAERFFGRMKRWGGWGTGGGSSGVVVVWRLTFEEVDFGGAAFFARVFFIVSAC